MKEFVGLPDPATLFTTEPPPLWSHGKAKAPPPLSDVAYLPSLCIWAGVQGALSGFEPSSLQSGSWAAYTRSTVGGPDGNEGALALPDANITTFAFCYQYRGSNLFWKTLYNFQDAPEASKPINYSGGGSQAVGGALQLNGTSAEGYVVGEPVKAKDNWCYLQGITVYGGASFGLKLDRVPDPLPPGVDGSYYFSTGGGSVFNQCLTFAQPHH
jgi:hypothetical protein